MLKAKRIMQWLEKYAISDLKSKNIKGVMIFIRLYQIVSAASGSPIVQNVK